jgi:dCMP deaminase
MQRERVSLERAYLRVAVALAGRSTCLDKQVGCVITNESNEIIATGYNGAPRGWTHCTSTGICLAEKFCTKDMCPSAHAEQNALLQCRVPEQIHTIYLTLSPCVGCIRIINNTPCKRIVFLNEHRHPEAKGMWKGEWIHVPQIF